MRCLSYCVVEKIDLNKLQSILQQYSAFQIKKHWEVLEAYDSVKGSHTYLFSNGAVVSWGLNHHELKDYFKWAKEAGSGIVNQSITDEFHYQQGNETTIAPHESFYVDCLTLSDDDPDLKLSLAYGFSQSIKLKYYESKIEKLIGYYMPLSHELARRGKTRLSYRRVQKIIGDILSVKGELNLVGDFLYQPKFFWQHPNLEEHFTMLERYLDIPKRTEALNQQLNTLHEIFLMCTSYLEARSAHHLEIIIVVLLAVEIIFNVLNLHF